LTRAAELLPEPFYVGVDKAHVLSTLRFLLLRVGCVSTVLNKNVHCVDASNEGIGFVEFFR